jgi:NAD(P)-dependent dehydrogenase (short-subunit alcohol dehydrogenase family)
VELDLSGKKALVTGAGNGIGLAVVEALVSAGADVLGGARTITEALRAATPHVFEVDLATPPGPRLLVERALAELGAIDVLVNNVGGGVKYATGFLDIEDETWQRAFELNVFSTIRATRAALPSLMDRRGAIINIGSVNARLADPRLAHYSAAKAALTNLGKSLSAEFSPYGVRVNTISPGPVRTRIWSNPDIARQAGLSPLEFLAAVPKMAGLSTGKMIEPGEVAALVVLLASGAVPSITGSDYSIDAGMTKSL